MRGWAIRDGSGLRAGLDDLATAPAANPSALAGSVGTAIGHQPGLAIAQEGGIGSIGWAGVGEADGRAAVAGGRPIQGTAYGAGSGVVLGVRAEGLGFELKLGMPGYDPDPSASVFKYDPGVLRERLWVGDKPSRHSLCMERKGPAATCYDLDRKPHVFTELLSTESAVSALRDPRLLPELHAFREHLCSFRFYDGFRVDSDSALRKPALGVCSPSLAADGSNLAACALTIFEIGDGDGFQASIRRAIGADVEVLVSDGPRFEIATRVDGVLRSMRAHELSDGSLRYIALATALFAPHIPPVVVLNEPEASLHPSLLEPLGHAILRAAAQTQVWVVTHSSALADVLRATREVSLADIALQRTADGAAQIAGQRTLDRPAWPER